jgi:Arc/MetJ-type ribon-helix-helix transcriptional regulator
MRTLQIKIPDELREFVDAQVSSGVYPSAAEMFSDLLLWHKRHVEDLAMRDRFLSPLLRKTGSVKKEDVERAWKRVQEKRLKELRADVLIGIDQLDRGEYFTYHSVEDCLADIKAESKRLLTRKRRTKA